MAPDHSSERSNLRGASSTGVLLALLLAAGLIAAAFAWFSPTREQPPMLASPQGSTPAVVLPSGDASNDAPLAEIQRGEAPRVSTPTDSMLASPPGTFDGRGRIRGEMLAADNVTFPTQWTLVIEPSPILIGSEHAITKRVEYQAGERAFDVGDLPLAGYRVRAEAALLNSTEVSVPLIQGSHDVFATLQFRPAGFIEGRVRAHDGVPADGVDVVLESVETKLRRPSKADANGRYEFKDVLDGDYKLYVGSPESPLVPPGDIQFQAPSLRFKDFTLPPTGAIVLETRAESGAPLAHVDVSGFGSRGGAVRAQTDFQGRARLTWLPLGDFRLEGQSDDGRRGRIKITVEAGVDAPAIMHLR